MTAYYNEHDAFAAQWLRNLIAAGHIAPGVVDERDIQDVRPDDLREFEQCHFFAGIGGWSLALRLAGWADDRRPGPANGHWRAADWLACTDGKWRPVEPGTSPLADGISERVGRLRGYGNAIVPQQAAEIVRILMEHAP